MKVLITGGTHGMGQGVARTLVRRDDVELVILGRSEESLSHIADELSALGGQGRVSTVCCDLARLDDVRRAVDEILQAHPALDALFVNAGLGYAPERVETEDGWLEHYQVNYLSHFMLTLPLLERLEASTVGGRVIFNVTDHGELDFDNLQLSEGWTFENAVGVGMVAKHMMLLRLHQLYAARPEPRVSMVGFSIPKMVWSHQIDIIPLLMRAPATLMKWLGQSFSIDECGELMAPLFVDDVTTTQARAGRLLTHKDGAFVDVDSLPAREVPADWERLWNISLEQCADPRTTAAAARLLASP
jgi:hypothetical protein